MKYRLTDSRTFVYLIFCLFSFTVTGLDFGKFRKDLICFNVFRFNNVIYFESCRCCLRVQATSNLLNDGGICVLWTFSSNVFTFLLIVNFVSVQADRLGEQELKCVSENVNKSSTRAGRCFIL